jgi:hypothetical protein
MSCVRTNERTLSLALGVVRTNYVTLLPGRIMGRRHHWEKRRAPTTNSTGLEEQASRNQVSTKEAPNEVEVEFVAPFRELKECFFLVACAYSISHRST